MLMTNTTLLHVRFGGRSEELDLADLGLNAKASDAQVRAALAKRYDCRVADLNDYVIVREAEAIIVRPVAIYG